MRNLLLLAFFSVFSFSVFASSCSGTGGTGSAAIGPTGPPPSCLASPAAGNTCDQATPICNLNGYCGSTASTYTADYWCELGQAFCGSSIENNSFLKFIASSSTISFNMWVTSTQTGAGVQIMIFSMAGSCSGAVTSHTCYNPGSVATGSVTISASGLTPGNTYYIMIDGNGGDVCNYVISANTGVSTPVMISPANPTVCLGGSVDLTASGGSGTYTWTASPDLNTTSGSLVTVTPPNTAGSYQYEVSSSTGNALCPSTVTATATVIVQPCGCSITASNDGAVCSGGTSNLSATAVTGATYSWTGPNGFTSTDQNPPTFSPPGIPGVYDYTVTATSVDGTCMSTTSITVNANPTAVVPNDTSVCNNSVIPAANFTSTPAGATFAWTNSDPSIGLAASGNGNIPSFTATNPGTAPLTATITVTPTLNGCTGLPETYTITVAPTPVMNTVSSISQCHGSTVSAVNFSSTLTGITYAWTNSNTSIGAAASGTGNIPSFTATNTGSTPVTGLISVTPSLGTCSGTPVTFNITVNPLPAVDAGSAQTVCSGTNVTLSGSGATTYTWNNGVTNNTAFPATATQTYTVTGTDANGCVNTDNVLVTVNPIPTVNAGIDQTICVGPSVTLTATGATTYTWTNGVTNGVAFAPTTTNTYTVTGTSANGCQNTDQVIVTVNPLPSINAGADQNICAGTNVTLSGTGGTTYVWTGGVTNGQAFAPAIGTNTYTVTGTDANGCVNTDAITITVLAVPVADLTADIYQGYPTLTVNFLNASTNATSYVWDFGNGVAPFSTSTTGTQTTGFINIGTYEVVFIASNGICSDSIHTNIIVLPFPPPQVFVPNVFTPNGDNSNEEFWLDVKYGATIEVQIFNRWGNMVHEMNDFTDKWDGKVNGNDVSDGVYFFKYTVTGIDQSTVQGHGYVTVER